MEEEVKKHQHLRRTPCGNLDVLRGKETVISHEETGNTTIKHSTTGGILAEESPKNLKRTMTSGERTFTEKFNPPPSKVDNTCKKILRHVQDRSVSIKKNGG